jgi:hypothetical protein
MISEYLNIAKQYFPEDSIHYYKNEDFYVDGYGLSPFFSHFVLLKYVSDNTLFVAPKIAISKLNDGYELIPLSKYNNLAENFSLFTKIENISLSKFSKECENLLSKIKQAQIDYKLKRIQNDFT